VIKSNSHRNLVLSIENNVWATQRHNEEKFNEAFRTAPHVILIFSVNSSGGYQGYAKMLGAMGASKKTHVFKGFGRAFDLKWLRLNDLDFGEVAEIQNALNENKSVKISRMGRSSTALRGRGYASLWTRRFGVAIPRATWMTLPRLRQARQIRPLRRWLFLECSSSLHCRHTSHLWEEGCRHPSCKHIRQRLLLLLLLQQQLPFIIMLSLFHVQDMACRLHSSMACLLRQQLLLVSFMALWAAAALAPGEGIILLPGPTRGRRKTLRGHRKALIPTLAPNHLKLLPRTKKNGGGGRARTRKRIRRRQRSHILPATARGGERGSVGVRQRMSLLLPVWRLRRATGGAAVPAMPWRRGRLNIKGTRAVFSGRLQTGREPPRGSESYSSGGS